MKNAIFFSLVIIFIGCKNEKKYATDVVTSQVENKQIIYNNLFKVIVDITILEDDRLQLFYVDDTPDGAFSAEKRLEYNVKGNNSSQKIQFTLPDKVFPFKFRIDLGENKKQSTVKINTIKLKYNSDSITIRKSELDFFLKPNIYLENTGDGYHRKTIHGRNDPFLVSAPLLNKKVQIEFKK